VGCRILSRSDVLRYVIRPEAGNSHPGKNHSSEQRSDMTEDFAGILEESRRAVVYMQLPIVGFLAIASFQVRRAQDKAAFALAGYGWIFNIVYIA
jgi:hypothetical protein